VHPSDQTACEKAAHAAEQHLARHDSADGRQRKQYRADEDRTQDRSHISASQPSPCRLFGEEGGTPHADE